MPGSDADIVMPKPIRGAEFIAVIDGLIQRRPLEPETTTV
jgi:hypothetical protein